MKRFEVLLNAKHHRKSGSHRTTVYYNELTGEKEGIEYYYHDSLVCIIYVKKKTYFISDCGYPTASTHRLLAQLMEYLEEKGYKMNGCYLSSHVYFPYKFVHR